MKRLLLAFILLTSASDHVSDVANERNHDHQDQLEQGKYILS